MYGVSVCPGWPDYTGSTVYYSLWTVIVNIIHVSVCPGWPDYTGSTVYYSLWTVTVNFYFLLSISKVELLTTYLEKVWNAICTR